MFRRDKVAQLRAQGFSVGQISKKLGITKSTVYNHLFLAKKHTASKVPKKSALQVAISTVTQELRSKMVDHDIKSNHHKNQADRIEEMIGTLGTLGQ